MTNIDQTLLSRIEMGERMPTETQLSDICEALNVDFRDFGVDWLADKLVKLVGYSPFALEALQVAESRMEYLYGRNALQRQSIPESLNQKLEELEMLRDRWVKKPKMSTSQLARMHQFFDIEYTYDSNKIEGNTLSLQETALVINEGLTIGGKSMREHLEAINHAEAIGFVRGLVERKEDIGRRVLLDIHRLILKGVDSDHAGRYRSVQVRISGSEYEFPQPFQLDKLMEDYFHFYRQEMNRMHPVILAAEMHERLVSIHPFIDGNGRTARLIMNLVLLRNGYTRANIKGTNANRLAYYQALQEVQLHNNREPFYTLVVDECILSLKAHLDLI